MENTVLCRLCAVEKDTYVDGYICIYSEEGVKLNLERKIITCLHIELQPSDALPKVVCLECCSKLRQCADFVESSEAAQARLIGLLGLQVKNEESCDYSLPGETVIKLERGDSSDESPDNNRPHARLHIDQVSDGEESSSRFDTRKHSNSTNSGKYSGCTRSRASNKRKCRLPVRVSVEPQLDEEIDEDGSRAATSAANADDNAEDDDDDDDDDDDEEEDDDTYDVDDEDDDDNDDVVPLDNYTSRSDDRKEKRRKKSARRERHKVKKRDSEKRRSDSQNQDESGLDSDSPVEIPGGDGASDSSKDWAEEEATPPKRKRDVLKNYTWMCSDCSEELSDAESLRAHHLVVHKQEPKFMCAQCSKVYTKYHGFVSHVRRHPAYKYRCEVCGKCCSKQRLLDTHRLTHAASGPDASSGTDPNRSHICAVCGKGFRQQSALYLHSRCHLPEEVKNKYTCDQCHKRFSTKPNLVTHQRIHAGVRNFTCDQCGKSFVQKGNLEAHLLTHSTAKPHICPLCGKGFKTELQLRKHGSVHTGVKPHQCDICGRQFRERGTLREHHRIHTGAMPFSCEFCGKSFRFKGVLTTHRRQHTGERPYSCLECQHHFTNWPNYNKHMKRRHGINTSRQSRTPSGPIPSAGAETTVNTGTGESCVESSSSQALPQTSHVQSHQHTNDQSLLHQHSLDVQKQMPVLLSVPEPQPLLHKMPGNSELTMYHDDSVSSRHENIEPQPLVHKIPQMYPMHSAHGVQPHVHGHSNLGLHDDVHREMVRERDSRPPHFYNPAPGQAVNTNPYLHQSQLQSLQQSIQQSLHQSQLPGLYGLPQLPIDPGHLEMLHSSGQLR